MTNLFYWCNVAHDLFYLYGFNANIYEPRNAGGNSRSYQYVMDGLKLQGCGSGFVVGRDAIIAGQQVLTGGEDTCTLWSSFSRRGLGFSAVQGTTNRNDNDEAFDTHPDCLSGFQAPVHQEYGELSLADAGRTVPLRFTIPGASGLDVLASNSPFSRKVDCETLRVPSQGDFVTPRELPITTEPGGQLGPLAQRGRRLPLQLADGGGVGRHVSRARAHARRWCPAPRLLPVRRRRPTASTARRSIGVSVRRRALSPCAARKPASL